MTDKPKGLPTLEAYWSMPAEQVLAALEASPQGLSRAEAAERLERYGHNALREERRATPLTLLLRQFRSPLVLVLIAAAAVSAVVGEWTDAAIVLAVVLGSTLLGFSQEYRAAHAVEALRSRIAHRCTVLRDGQRTEVPAEEIVPGDVVLVSAGSLIPADGLLLEADALSVNQAALTGESFAVDKTPGTVAPAASLAERTNVLMMGSSVASGTGTLLVVKTGSATVLGQTARRLSLRPPETDFERGVGRLSVLLTQIMLVIVVAVLAANIALKRPLMDSLLFSLALAVGLTPELLPAIISITLSQGAQRMAQRGVIVRRLNAIEDLGSMDVLCTDKTGTLTRGVVSLDGALDASGSPSAAVLRLAALNATLQTGLANALDVAIQQAASQAAVDLSTETKIDEIPYDFVRKRLSVVTRGADGAVTLITKGALEQVLSVCDSVQEGDVTVPLDDARRAAIRQAAEAAGEQGYRVLGVAIRSLGGPNAQSAAGPGVAPHFTREDEQHLTFVGTLQFFDPPKDDTRQVIADLAWRGVALKIISGDSRQVARHVAQAVGLEVQNVVTGRDLHEMTEEALHSVAERTTVFAEVDPNQKERIILALRRTRHVVGYMGDGINDASALHAADVGISVDTAVDVAKEAADLVLLSQELDVLRQGIDEGRRTFANTLKYVLTTTSANFGNMISMAAATMVLPYLPLLASQVLLNNFLSDIPATTIASDNVDREWIERPHSWSMPFIRDYMVLFGLVSSIFDAMTFILLLRVFQVNEVQFHTGWFVESLLSELVIALVVRTRHHFWESRPARPLLVTSLAFSALTLVLPYSPLARAFGFEPLPVGLLAAVVGLSALYIAVTELAKSVFYGHLDRQAARGPKRGAHRRLAPL